MNTMTIQLDHYTMRRNQVDIELYQKSLQEALGQYKLEFLFAQDQSDSLGFKYALVTVGGIDVQPDDAYTAAKDVWPNVLNTKA